MSLLNSFGSKVTLKIAGMDYTIYRLRALQECGVAKVLRLPYSIRVLLENLLRNEDGKNVTRKDIERLATWDPARKSEHEIAFTPARVLLQDFTGVPAVVDLAAMREAMVKMGGDPKKINPFQPVDLVIDHSVQTDFYGTSEAFAKNIAKEFERNRERYQFLKWGQQAFRNFRVVPPATGIIHQVNLEYLSPVIFAKKEGGKPNSPSKNSKVNWASPGNLLEKENGSQGKTFLYPDTLVGTDSHTTMINGLGVLGWGVGGIEAEAAMLGQPISMLIPEVVGMKFSGKLSEGVTATDLVLTVTQILRKKGVVGKFVEFFGPGISELSLADRAVVANMAPEYGATAGFFPVDKETIDFLKLTGRSKEQIELAETYLKEQGLFREGGEEKIVYSDVVELNLASVVPSLAGPKRPQDRVTLKGVKPSFKKILEETVKNKSGLTKKATIEIAGEKYELEQGAVVIASITSCTNTSSPSVMLAAGILAKKALQKGLTIKPWVKTSLAPGSQVVTDYLAASGLLSCLEALRFNLVGYGCMTCIGNSGPLPEPVSKAVKEKDLVAASVLSGNRNFEGRVHAQVRANYLASPPLVVAYAIAGTVMIDLEKDPLGKGKNGKPVYLRDIWPSSAEIREALKSVDPTMFRKRYKNVFEGNEPWRSLSVLAGNTFCWDKKSAYVKQPPYFKKMPALPAELKDIKNARVLAVLGDSITTDHISPAGAIAPTSPAGKYLIEQGIEPKDFNSYGARRGNHEVMMRGTFANIRLKNLLVPGVEGGMTQYFPSEGKPAVMSIFDAAMRYGEEKRPLVILAGKEYGSGSSRDWAAKGPVLLGVRAVIAKSYERIHRSNLIGMGILPLQFFQGQNAASFKLTGEEFYSIKGIAKGLKPGKILTVKVSGAGKDKTFEAVCRIDTPVELEYYRHGGILQYVLRQLLK